LSGNTAGFDGGGISNSGRLALHYSTLSGNAAHSGAGGLLAGGRFVTIQSSILAGNTVEVGTGPDCVVFAGVGVSSQGYNLVGEHTGCPLQAAGDRTVAPADVFTQVLGPLQDNGGPTLTHALLPGSPALDAIPEGINGCGTDSTQDQRGVPRPQGTGGDIGAYEAEAP